MRIPIGPSLVFLDVCRRFFDFDLLDDSRRLLAAGQKRVTAIGTAVESVRKELVDSLGRKTGPQVPLVPRLPAPLAFLPAPFGSFFFGLTMSLDGGLDEVEEFLRALANWSRNWAFSCSSSAIRANASASCSSSLSSRSARGLQSEHLVISRGFMVGEHMHSRPMDQYQLTREIRRNPLIFAEILLADSLGILGRSLDKPNEPA